MSAQLIGKTFKSGNSLALRLPKSLGFGEGDEVRVVPHDDGSFTIWKVADDKKRLMALYGAMSPGFMSEGRGDIEQEDRDWTPGRPAEAA